MSAFARKLVVSAGVDGLVIQPLSPKGQRLQQPIRVYYGDSIVSAAPRDQTSNSFKSFEAFGIIGLITVSKISYLVTVVRRQQVAQIRGLPVYAVAEVAITPCTSQSDAEESIARVATMLDRRKSGTQNEDGQGGNGDEEPASKSLDEAFDDDIEDEVLIPHDSPRPDSKRRSVAEDVIRPRGSYGRFAQSWFSQTGWTMDQRRSMGMSIAAASESESVLSDGPVIASEASPGDARASPSVSSLLPKLLRTVSVLFGSSESFYFSYDVDITRSLVQDAMLFRRDAPICAQVDSNFFWNRHILQPFISAGQDSLILPLMQGFVGQQTFVVDSHPPQTDDLAAESLEMRDLNISTRPRSPLPEQTEQTGATSKVRPSEREYLLTLISRRSVKRAGLRYLRRGVNEDGFAANAVETEQILSTSTWDSSRPTRSFVQFRGSIPLFFSQSAYSLKPTPVLQHSLETNLHACRKHFDDLSKTYGSLQVVNLVEKQGIEEPIGSRYKECIERLNQDTVELVVEIPFEWFDFHQVCRGMKFENVSHLLIKLRDRLEAMGSTVQLQGKTTQRQTGVLRTNCMDCLDRTNVCQSSFAKHMLEVQLKADGIDMGAQLDQETTWFNTLWADNGDAISKQYASTAAMKGDYTRTRKRDYRGALNDLGLSLARFYNGMVNDHFSQAAMDFLLGNVTAKIFDEFEADMMTKDPAVSVAHMRERAIELCQQRVVADMSEEVQGGWALISPSTADAVKSWTMEDVILLLTDAALYLCHFDWDLDKVSSFERVHLANVTRIKLGTYITSTVSPAHMDESKNVGFVVEYQPGKSNMRRVNTRTLSSFGDVPTLSAAKEAAKEAAKDGSRSTGFGGLFSPKTPKMPETRKLALKAPYASSSAAVSGTPSQQTEMQLVVGICAEIERLALERQFRKKGDDAKGLVEREDIISSEAAKRNTGLLEQLGHSIKKLVWA